MNRKRVLLVAGGSRERKFLRESLKALGPLSFDYKCVYAQGVIESSYITALELSASHFDLVISVGFCGGGRGFEISDVVMPCRSELEGLLPPVRLTTASEEGVVVKTSLPRLKHATLSDKDSYIYDSETYAVASVCSDFGVDCSSVRIVSYMIESESYLNEYNDGFKFITNFDSVVYAITSLLNKLNNER